MSRARSNSLDPVNAVIALGVWLTAITVYTLTRAPTLSFWDCGEFIAAGYILGVPHPPGTPLYIIAGRVFSVIPWSSDIAARVNMLSVVTSSFTALFGYLTAVRILRACYASDRSTLTRWLIYAGSAAGAFSLAFGLTNWNNSVEAEVYGMSMMMLVAILWLAMIYTQRKGTPSGERIMLLIFFVAFAGIGVHMTTFLVLPVVAPFFVLKKGTSPKVWLALAAFFILELYFIFATSSRPDEIPYFLPLMVVLIFFLFYIFSYEKIPALYLYVGGGFLLSILPVYVVGINALKKASGSALPVGVFTTIGVVFFVGQIIFGLYLLYRYFSMRRANRANQHYLIASSFILVAVAMTALLFTIKGYTAFLAVTVVLAAALAAALRKHINWPILLAVVSVLLVLEGPRQCFFGVAVAAVAILLLGLMFKVAGWRNALLIILVAVLGYSVHLFIPIRSARQPMINENNPSQSLTSTINFLERKQYLRQSMTERMFKRRAEWANQFGDFRRMGFWGFFSRQFGISGPKFIFPFVLGLFGVWEITRKRPEIGAPFLVLLLISSIGLVLYMNFADGTRQHPVTGADYIEVRDRDYFFTPAFILFALALGMGLTFLVQFIREAVRKFSPVVRRTAVAASLVVFLLPSYALANNYYYADRSNNHVPFDYAWNILISADDNAVLFTMGDNDTFTLWCLQEVYGIRKDVSVVNLSLANTKWYIKQLGANLGVRLSWSDSDVDRLRVFRDQSGNVHRLQNQVVSEVIKENLGGRPINFCVTVPPATRAYRGRRVDSLLSLRGMVWRMNETGSGIRKDIESCIDLFTSPDKFKYRGLADPSVYKDETASRLTRNYARGFMQVADSLKNAGELDRVEQLMEAAVERIPHSTDATNYLAAFYSEHGKRRELLDLINATEYGDTRWLAVLLGDLERRLGNDDKAEAVYREVLAENPSYKPALDELIRLYYDNRRYGRLRQVMRAWIQSNPDDQTIKTLLRDMENELRKMDSLRRD